MIQVTWTELKGMVDTGQIRLKYIERTKYYKIYGFDATFMVCCELDKNPSDTADLDDFEANYKPAGNTVLSPVDTDGVALNRTKITRTAWHFQVHSVEFETAKLASIYNKDSADTDIGFSSIKFYDVNDTELTVQGDIDTDCVKTVLEWEASHDIDIIGGTLHQTTPPASDVRLWIIAAPDVPKGLGGSVDFLQGGMNLRRLGVNTLDINGITAKTMPYDATYHTNKFKFVVRHDAGFKCPVFVAFKFFKDGTV